MKKDNSYSIFKDFYKVELLFALLFCYIWPFGGLLISLFPVIFKKNSDKTDFICLIISLSFFLAFINSTKTISSDTIHYLNWYNEIDRTDLINSFLFYRGVYSISEPLFAIISIAIYLITSGSEIGYLFFCSFIIYTIQLYAILLVAKKFEIDRTYIVCLFLMLAFVNPLFNQSVHAIRQMIATSFLMLAIAIRVVCGKNSWWMLIAAFLTHVSVLVYIPLVLLSICYKEVTTKRALVVGCLVFLLIVVSDSIGSLLSGMGSEVLTAAGEKIVQSTEHNQMELGLRGFYLYNIPFIIVTMISIFSNKGKYPDLNIYYYLYIITFCVVVINPISTEVSIRYSFYIFSFFQYSFLLYILTNSERASIVIWTFTFILVGTFFWLLGGDSTYASISNILFKIFPFF